MVVTKSHVRTALVILVVACALLSLLVITGVVTSPFNRSHVQRARIYFLGADEPAASLELDESCDCMWQIGCPKFRWQTNFTSPIYRCGYEIMTESLVGQCLAQRQVARGREMKLHVVGHMREAFLVDYLRQRLSATTDKQNCGLFKAPVAPKDLNSEDVIFYGVDMPKDSDTCEGSYSRPGIKLNFKYVELLGPDVFSYVDRLTTECQTSGCEGDILIMSGGMGELLNSTLLDSFTGVRKFQRQYERLLPMLIDLVKNHRLEVVWKIHEPVTDELIPENSMVRNDLLQEYNALIMEQTMSTPIQVWTSHMLMKLHHIEDCDSQAKSATINEDAWRCEEELVPGDKCHAEYFDAIFNKVCDKHVKMPENPCCSA